MTSNYSGLLVLMRVDLPHCDDPLLVQTLQQTGREFCRRTEIWLEKLTMNIVDAPAAYTTAYNAAIALGMSAAAAVESAKLAETAARDYVIKPHYDVEIPRLQKVWDTGDETDPVADPSRYQFFPSTNTLRWNANLTTYTPTATTWTALASYTAGDYVINSSLRYLCAITHTAGATFATDLAAYKWQLMPNDLIVKAVMIPRVTCNELAAWFMEKWAEGIIAGAKSKLMAQKNKNWSSPERVSFFEQEYNRYVCLALRERFTDNKATECTFSTPQWIK